MCLVLCRDVGTSCCDGKLCCDGFLDAVLLVLSRASVLNLSALEIDDGDDGKRGVFALLKVR